MGKRNVVTTPGDAQDAPVTFDDAGDPEMSEKDVELLLAQRDLDALAASEPVPLAPADIDPAALDAIRDEHIASFVAAELPHALDLAPINAKIVVILDDNRPHAILAGPDGAKALPVGDPAHRLPEGARICKKAEDRYEAEQLSATVAYPVLVTETAVEAIAKFLPHFHPLGGTPS